MLRFKVATVVLEAACILECGKHLIFTDKSHYSFSLCFAEVSGGIKRPPVFEITDSLSIMLVHIKRKLKSLDTDILH
jgi:hypothetical protein